MKRRKQLRRRFWATRSRPSFPQMALRKRIDDHCANGCHRCRKLRRIHSDDVSVRREPSVTFFAPDKGGEIWRLFAPRNCDARRPTACRRRGQNGSIAYRLDRKIATLKTLHAVHLRTEQPC